MTSFMNSPLSLSLPRVEWIFESTVDQRTFRSVDWLTPNNSAFRSTIQLSHRPIIIIFVTKFIIIIIIGPLSSFKIQEISLEPDGNLTHCSFSIPGKCLPTEISHLLKKRFLPREIRKLFTFVLRFKETPQQRPHNQTNFGYVIVYSVAFDLSLL